jgi:beta-lactamase superfamily II metal-dependent hydrolase
MRTLRIALWALLLWVASAITATAQRPTSRELTVRILDVGQGDAILTRTAARRCSWMAGPTRGRSAATWMR